MQREVFRLINGGNASAKFDNVKEIERTISESSALRCLASATTFHTFTRL